MSQDPTPQPTFTRWMGSMWMYSILRFGLFFVLWGVMELVGLRGLVAAFVGLVLSIPLGLVLLQRPRAAVAGNIEKRLDARRKAREDLDAQLDPDPETDD